MKSISKQLICISIITLLVSVSYTSAIRVDNEIPIVDNQGEHDCGCNDFSDADIIKLEKQLKNLERNNKLLLELSKDFPIVNRKIEKLSYKISNIKEELASGPPNPILCIILIGLLIDTYIIISIIFYIIHFIPFVPDKLWEIYSNIVFVLINEELVLIIYHCDIGPYAPTLFNMKNLITESNPLHFRDLDI